MMMMMMHGRTLSRTTRIVCYGATILLLCLLSVNVSAFAPLPSLSSFGTLQLKQRSTQRQQQRDHLLLPRMNLVLDPETATTALHHFASSSQQLLADAADVATDTGAKEVGWWGAYIGLFKSALLFVHSGIDAPLRSVGFDQTWGAAILLFTFGIRSLLIPLSIQQSKSAEYMKALKPYTAQIKERFKNNENAQNRALGKLYEDANQNPLSGCLLSLAQIPIFLGLYRGVRLLAMDGKLEEPFLWIPSLEGPVSGPDFRGLDWLLQGWTPAGGGGPLPFVPSMGWETTLAFLAMPVILVLLQSVTMQVLQPPVDDAASEEEKKTLESTQGVIKFLPLLIGFFSLQVPAGLTIYWFASNIFTLTQSLTVRAYFAANPPNITLPEYWDKASEVAEKDFADLTPEERRQATEMGIKIGPTMEDLIDEGRFHVFIERPPLRQSTAAWERLVVDGKTNDSGILATTNSVEIPEALQHWVALKMDDLATKTHNIVDDKMQEHKDKPDLVTTNSETNKESEVAATNTTTIMQA